VSRNVILLLSEKTRDSDMLAILCDIILLNLEKMQLISLQGGKRVVANTVAL